MEPMELKSDYRLYERYMEIKPNVMSYFHYLNDRLCTFNKCLLRIDWFDPLTYAEFRRPNIISLKLGSIVNIFLNYPDHIIGGVILLALAHEMIHANQSASLTMYGANPDYRTRVENDAEYRAQHFLLSNADDIKRRFGIDMYKIFALHGLTEYDDELIEFDLTKYYCDNIVDLFVKRLGKTFIHIHEMMYLYDLVILSFDGIEIVIKDKGQILNKVNEFNAIMHNYRKTTLLNIFRCKIEFVQISNKDNDIGVKLMITTNDVKYIPLQVNLASSGCI